MCFYEKGNDEDASNESINQEHLILNQESGFFFVFVFLIEKGKMIIKL